MRYEQLIEPREISVGSNTIVISKIPSVQSLEIYGEVFKACEKYGDFGITMIPNATVEKILGYCNAISPEGNHIELNNKITINQYLPTAYNICEVLVEMQKENWDFLTNGRLLALIESLSKSK